MSKINMADVIKSEPKKKDKKPLIPKATIIFVAVFSIVIATSIILIVNKLVNLPFQTGSRNLNVVIKDTVSVSEQKIDQVRKSFLLILPNSFWDHVNFTDIDYSSKTIGLAVNNVLGYDMKKQKWNYYIADDGISEIVSVVGNLTLDNDKFAAIIQFNIVDDYTYFYDLQLKEDRRRARFLPATPKQKSILIQTMYRG